MTVLCGIGLEAFKTGLGILKNAGAFIDHDILILCQFTLIPSAIFIVGDEPVVCLPVREPQRRPVNLFLVSHNTILPFPCIPELRIRTFLFFFVTGHALTALRQIQGF